MHPATGVGACWQVSETLARLVEEQLVAATWRLELRLYALLAAALCASLAAHLFMLGQLQLKLDRAQQEHRRARRRLQSAGAEVLEGSSSLPEQEPSAAAASESDLVFETQSQPTLSSQASEPAAMQTRPRRAATEPALWTVWEGASEGGDETDRGQQIAGDGGSGDGLNSDQQFGVSGQASELELIQTLQSMREMLRQKLE